MIFELSAKASLDQIDRPLLHLPRGFGELARLSSIKQRHVWFALALTLALAASAHLETVNLLRPPAGGPDEGVYLIAARLLNYGYPYSTFFFDQFPLFPQVIGAAFRVGGDTVLTGRLTIVLFSLLGLLLLASLAWLLQWRAAAPLAVLFAVVHPYYLGQSRYTLAEVPSITLLLAALLGVLLYMQGARRVWLVAAAVCFSISLLIKPLAVGFGLTIAWWLIARVVASECGWRLRARELTLDLALFGCASLLTALPFLDLFHLAAEFEKTAGFHLAETRFYAPQLVERQFGLISFGRESWAWLGLALLGAGVAARKAPDRIVPLVLGEFASAGVLLQLPPFQHHYAILVPVLALLAAIGVQAGGASLIAAFKLWVVRVSRTTKPAHVADQASYVLAGAFLLVTAIGLNEAGQVARLDYNIINKTKNDQDMIFALVKQYIKPGDFVISDDAMAVYRAGGLIPPPTINLTYESTCNLFAGCRQKLEESVRDYPVKAVLDTGLFGRNPAVRRWLKNHFPVRETRAKKLYSLGVRIYTRE